MTSPLRTLGFTFVAIIFCGLPAFGQGFAGRQLPSNRMLNVHGLELAWTANAAINSSRDRVETLVVDEETVFVQTRNGFITAIDAETGERRWSQLPARIDTPTFPVTTNADTVVVVAGMELIAFNKWNGGQLWRLPLQEQPSNSPTLDGERIYIPGSHGSVYAYDMPKIQQLYDEGKLPEWEKTAIVWRHNTSGAIKNAPVVISWDDNSVTTGNVTEVVFASDTGIMYAVGADNHKLGLQFETHEPASTALGWLGTYVYLATEDQHVYCVDVRNLAFVWEFAARSPVRTPPRVVQGRLYLSPMGGTLYCIEARSGRELWKEEQARKFVAQIGTRVIANDNLGNLLIIEPGEISDDILSTFSDVKITGRLPLRQFPIRGHNELTDRIFLCSESGTVIGIRPQGSAFPRYFKHPNSRPIEPLLAAPTPEAPEPAPDANN